MYLAGVALVHGDSLHTIDIQTGSSLTFPQVDRDRLDAAATHTMTRASHRSAFLILSPRYKAVTQLDRGRRLLLT